MQYLRHQVCSTGHTFSVVFHSVFPVSLLWWQRSNDLIQGQAEEEEAK